MPEYDIEQLRQLVHREPAQPAADPSHPRVVAHLEQHAVVLVEVPQLREPGLRVDVHRAELVDDELPAVAPDAHLPEQHRPGEFRLMSNEIFDSYTWDHDRADADPEIEYRPEEQRRQGLYSGIVDQIADALTVESDDAYRCKSLGKFWTEFDDPQSALGPLSGEIARLLSGFHPASAPVLWRVLVCQGEPALSCWMLIGIQAAHYAHQRRDSINTG